MDYIYLTYNLSSYINRSTTKEDWTVTIACVFSTISRDAKPVNMLSAISYENIWYILAQFTSGWFFNAPYYRNNEIVDLRSISCPVRTPHRHRLIHWGACNVVLVSTSLHPRSTLTLLQRINFYIIGYVVSRYPCMPRIFRYSVFYRDNQNNDIIIMSYGYSKTWLIMTYKIIDKKLKYMA